MGMVRDSAHQKLALEKAPGLHTSHRLRLGILVATQSTVKGTNHSIQVSVWIFY